MTESMDIAALTARLEQLETAEAARSALYRYAEGADSRDWNLLGSAFAEDAVLEMPGSVVTGRTAIVDSLRGMLPTGLITQHLIVNPRAEWSSPGRAQVRATVYYAHEGSGFEAVGWGEYRDDVAVVDGLGLITRKVFTPARHLPGSVATVSSDVQTLETAELARQATWRYATAVDTADFDMLAGVFAEHGSLTTRRGTMRGRDNIVAYYRTALSDPVARKHLLTNQKVTSTRPGEATVESYFLFTYAGNGSSTIGWGNYVDTVVVVDGVGYIVDKTISIDVHADSREGWGGETA